MIWVAVLVLTVVAVAPLAMPLWRRVPLRGRQNAAVDLHRAQLAELDRDLAEGRIAQPEHATAVLEVQRRLLAAAATADVAATSSSPAVLVAMLVVVPVGALALYLVNGHPGMPDAPLAARMAEADRRLADGAAMAQQLRDVLARVDPRSEQARQGYLLLGNVLASQGDERGAVDAWTKVLAIHFDPLLAARTADATAHADGGMTPAAATLFRRALAAAPPDAPWREAVEQRLAAAQNN